MGSDDDFDSDDTSIEVSVGRAMDKQEGSAVHRGEPSGPPASPTSRPKGRDWLAGGGQKDPMSIQHVEDSLAKIRKRK
jgi:hypothetical protein